MASCAFGASSLVRKPTRLARYAALLTICVVVLAYEGEGNEGDGDEGQARPSMMKGTDGRTYRGRRGHIYRERERERRRNTHSEKQIKGHTHTHIDRERERDKGRG